ncbi:hypothetical protein B0H16DRAFT_1485390 [Mycena metata]|uniref:Uncharacterized protein n=1 Tax=Mycena metata TaxID=1033252 RepID=A0AAD7GMX6_9AGAR|nr:hypothetical protein B0H16DRAFT_1485390 [Mycena metata]
MPKSSSEAETMLARWTFAPTVKFNSVHQCTLSSMPKLRLDAETMLGRPNYGLPTQFGHFFEFNSLHQALSYAGIMPGGQNYGRTMKLCFKLQIFNNIVKLNTSTIQCRNYAWTNYARMVTADYSAIPLGSIHFIKPSTMPQFREEAETMLARRIQPGSAISVTSNTSLRVDSSSFNAHLAPIHVESTQN